MPLSLRRPDVLGVEPPMRAPQQARSRATRDQLRAAALAEFAAFGYAATSVEMIAARAGVSVGAFYQHFRSKRHLLVVLVDDLLTQIARDDIAFGVARDRRSSIRRLLASALVSPQQHAGAYRAWQEACLADTELARLDDAIHGWMLARIRTVIDQLRRLPSTHPDVDVPGLANVIEHLFWRWLLLAMNGTELERDRWLDSATHVTYHALFAEPTRRPVRGWRRRQRAANR